MADGVSGGLMIKELSCVRISCRAAVLGVAGVEDDVREWKRLKRIPQGSVEYGVIRNYVSVFVIVAGMLSLILHTARMANSSPVARLVCHRGIDHFGDPS